MNETKDTPGPLDKINEQTVVGYNVASGADIKADSLQVWAYRRLDVYPDLLVACQRALREDHCTPDMDAVLSAAIAKAEGVSR